MASEKAKMLAGELYDPMDSVLVEEREEARRLTRLLNRTTETDDEARASLVEELFGSAGEDAFLEPPFRCDYGSNIHVGDGFFANFDCVVLDVCEVRVGDRCLLGPGVHIYTATHPLRGAERAKGLESGEPVTIGDDVWIGGQAVINPGVTVGSDAVVTSGAVVTRDVPDGVVVGGNPAKVIKEIE